MKKQISLIALLLLFTTPCLKAQKKELSQARSYIKSGKDFDKAEKLMTDLLAKDSASRENPKVYMMWYQAVLRQYEAGNEKLYLNQKYDTAAIFNLTKRMFTVLEALDSIDADQTGKAESGRSTGASTPSGSTSVGRTCTTGAPSSQERKTMPRHTHSSTHTSTAPDSPCSLATTTPRPTRSCPRRHTGQLSAQQSKTSPSSH